MKIYKEPKLEIIRFNSESVIVTSTGESTQEDVEFNVTYNDLQSNGYGKGDIVV